MLPDHKGQVGGFNFSLYSSLVEVSPCMQLGGGPSRMSAVQSCSGALVDARASNRQSDGDHLARSVPTSCKRGSRVNCVQSVKCDRRSRPSVFAIGRRRSVGSGSRLHSHARIRVNIVLTHMNAHCYASHSCVDERYEQRFSVARRLKPISAKSDKRVSKHLRTCYPLNVVAELVDLESQ